MTKQFPTKSTQELQNNFQSARSIFKNNGKAAFFYDFEPDDISSIVQLFKDLKDFPETNAEIKVVITNGDLNRDIPQKLAKFRSLAEYYLTPELTNKIKLEVLPNQDISFSNGKYNYWNGFDSEISKESPVIYEIDAEENNLFHQFIYAQSHGLPLEHSASQTIMTGFNLTTLIPENKQDLEKLNLICMQYLASSASSEDRPLVSLNQVNLADQELDLLDHFYFGVIDGEVKSIPKSPISESILTFTQTYLDPDQIQNAISPENQSGHFYANIRRDIFLDRMVKTFQLDFKEVIDLAKKYEIKIPNLEENMSGTDIKTFLNILSFLVLKEKKQALPKVEDIQLAFITQQFVNYEESPDFIRKFNFDRKVDFAIKSGLYLGINATLADANMSTVMNLLTDNTLERDTDFVFQQQEVYLYPPDVNTGKIPTKKVENGDQHKNIVNSKKSNKVTRPVLVLTATGAKKVKATTLKNITTSKHYSDAVIRARFGLQQTTVLHTFDKSKILKAKDTLHPHLLKPLKKLPLEALGTRRILREIAGIKDDFYLTSSSSIMAPHNTSKKHSRENGYSRRIRKKM